MSRLTARFALLAALPLPAFAQGASMSPMPGMAAPPASAASAALALTPSSAMPAMPAKHEMGAMQGGPAPAGARDPDAYADGLAMGHMPGMDMADDAIHAYVLGDRVEQFRGRHGSGQAVDAQGWIGGDLDKLRWKVDGERAAGRLGATRTEALWDHAVATYWSLQAGVRRDVGDGPGRNWAAFGFQGLAPYWFDLEGTAYLGPGGRTALRLEAEYDLRVTQRWVLQPDVEVRLYGRRDPERKIGAGLSDVDAGLRLRYEITRQFAPYVGVTWNRKVGSTAGYARQDGEPAGQARVVAGVRFWF